MKHREQKPNFGNDDPFAVIRDTAVPAQEFYGDEREHCQHCGDAGPCNYCDRGRQEEANIIAKRGQSSDSKKAA